MQTMKRAAFALFLFVALGPVCQGMSDFVFKHLGIADGLSHQEVYSIAQDREGFLWFGTPYGLDRFDGSALRNYQPMSSMEGRPVNRAVYVVAEDTLTGDLWLGGDGGISLLDAVTRTFVPFPENDKVEGVVWRIYFGREGKVWIYNYPNCLMFSKKTGGLTKYRFVHEGRKVEPTAVYVDGQGVCWFGFANVGIGCLDEERRRVRLAARYANTPLHLCDYGKDSLLMGTLSRGIYVVGKRGGGMRRLLLDGKGDDLYVNKIEPLSDGRCLIGTLSGIYVLEDGRLARCLRHDGSKPWSLSGNRIHDIYEDKERNIWVGTERSGVDFHSCRSESFSILQPDDRKKSREEIVVTALAEDADGQLWMGTEDGRLYACRRGPDVTPRYQPMEGVMGMRDGKAVNALAACGDEIWAGTFSNGIYVYDRKTGKTRHYYKKGKEGDLLNNEVFCIYPDSKGRVWVGTTTDLFLFHGETEEFERIGGLSHHHVVAISEDGDGRLWMATRNNGLKVLDASAGRVRGIGWETDAFFGGILSDVACGRDGSVWVASGNGGVCRYLPDGHRCDVLTQADGLPGNAVNKLLRDRDGEIWACTDGGVACIHPESMAVLRSFMENGMLGLGLLMPRTGVEGRDGTLYWGGRRGVLAFHPARLARPSTVRKVRVTGYTVFKGGKAEWRDFAPSAPGGRGGGEIRLQDDESTFSVSFSPMDYAEGNAGYCSYMMDGLDREWVVRKGISEVVYHNLAPGSYLFRVRYSMDGADAGTPVSEARVVVVPPWWRSPWAYGGYALLCLAAASAARYRWHRRRKRRNAVRAAMQEARKREVVYKAKMDFLAYMAHEVRTPFSIVQVALENLMAKWECPPDAGRELEMMGRAVGRLRHVVDDMLEFRALEADAMQADMRHLDFSVVLKMVCEAYSAVARKKGLGFAVEAEEGDYGVRADEEMLITVLSNLINNALKYAAHEIRLTVGTVAGGGEMPCVCMRIGNDGAGIPEEIRPRIFEPFVRGRQEGVESTGLGLPLALNLTRKMGGSLRLAEASRMTCFELRLPLDAVKEEQPGLPQGDGGGERLEAGRPQGNGGATVLVAEDHEELAACIVEGLSEDYTVVWVPDGEAAWAYARDREVDLVVSDVMMPRMDGMTLCGRLKNAIETCHVPVVLLTAKSFRKDYMEGVQAGADAYIGKPFSMEMLRTWVGNLLQNRRRVRLRLQREGVADVARTDFADADRLFFDRLRGIVLEHLDEEDFSLDALAGEMGMSRSTFQRKLKGLAGMTPNELVLAIRLDKAGELLRERRYKVGEVCYMVGFKSLSHFVRSFGKRFGCSPKKYMES